MVSKPFPPLSLIILATILKLKEGLIISHLSSRKPPERLGEEPGPKEVLGLRAILPEVCSCHSILLPEGRTQKTSTKRFP